MTGPLRASGLTEVLLELSGDASRSVLGTGRAGCCDQRQEPRQRHVEAWGGERDWKRQPCEERGELEPGRVRGGLQVTCKPLPSPYRPPLYGLTSAVRCETQLAVCDTRSCSGQTHPRSTRLDLHVSRGRGF